MSGQGVDFKRLNLETFGHQPDDMLLGNYINCYTGYAADEAARFHCASGGMVSALLVYALEKGLIDGALVTRMRKDSPLETEPFIARSKKEIMEAARSKYCPVAANTALRAALKSAEGDRLAVVGLPCHLHGLMKAGEQNRKLRDSIKLRLGLFCGASATFAGTKFILTRMGINPEDVAGLEFRGKGWPGGVNIRLKNGESRFLIHSQAVTLWSLFFIPRRCRQCCDGAAEMADISFGDAWGLARYAKDSKGASTIISRSRAGEALLHKARLAGAVIVEDSSAADMLESQHGMIYRKKYLNQAAARLSRKRVFYSGAMPELNFLDYLAAIWQSYLCVFGSSPAGSLLRHMPLWLIRLHSKPMGPGSYFFKQKLRRRRL